MKKRKRIRVNRIRLIRTVIVLVLIAVVGLSVKNVFDLQAEQHRLQKDNKDLTAEKAALKEELENINDKNYIEEQARIQLRLIKPGEILYIINKDENEKDNN